MIRDFLDIITKNFKVISSNKVFIFIIFFMPLLIIFLFGGLYFNTDGYNLKIGLSLENKTPLYQIYKESLEEFNFNIYEFDNKDNCFEKIEEGNINVCFLFPQNFSLKNNESLKVDILIDSTKKNIKPIIENYLIKILENQNKNIKEKIVIDIIQKLDKTKKTSDLTNQRIKSAIEINLEFSKEIKSFLKSVDNVKQNIRFLENQNNNFQISLEEHLRNLNESSDNITSQIKEIENSTKDLINSDIDNSKKDILKENLEKIEEIEDSLNKIILSKKNIENKNISSQILNAKKSINLIEVNLKNILEINKKSLSILQNIQQLTKNNFEGLSSLEFSNPKAIVNPIDSKFSNLSKSSSNHLQSIFPTLIIGMIVFLSTFFSSNFQNVEKGKGVFNRNILSPKSSFLFFFSNFVTLLSIIFIQMSILILTYKIFFLKSFEIVNPNIFLYILLPISIFILIGMLIGNICKNNISNNLSSLITVLIFLTLSGKILPVEILPQKLFDVLIYVNPYLVVELLFRKIFFFSKTFNDVFGEFLLLLLMFIFLFITNMILSSYIFKRRVYFFFIRNNYIKNKDIVNQLMMLDKHTSNKVEDINLKEDNHLNRGRHLSIDDEIRKVEDNLNKFNKKTK